MLGLLLAFTPALWLVVGNNCESNQSDCIDPNQSLPAKSKLGNLVGLSGIFGPAGKQIVCQRT